MHTYLDDEDRVVVIDQVLEELGIFHAPLLLLKGWALGRQGGRSRLEPLEALLVAFTLVASA